MNSLVKKLLILIAIAGFLVMTACNGKDNGKKTTDPARELVNDGILGIFSTGSGVLLHYIHPDTYELSTLSDDEARAVAFNRDHSLVCYADFFNLYMGDPSVGDFEMVSDGNRETPERLPTFLHDGRIAYAMSFGYTYSGIWAFHPDNNTVIDTLFTFSGIPQARRLKTSPSGRYISFTRSDRSIVYCLDIETLGPPKTPHFQIITSYQWGTLSDVMLQFTNYDVFFVDVEGDSTTTVVSTTGSNRIIGVAMSPDDTRFAYIVQQSTTSSQLYLARIDASTEPELLLDTADDGVSIRNIAFSPDGDAIAYYAASGTTGPLRIIDIDSGNIVTIVESCSNLNELIWN